MPPPNNPIPPNARLPLLAALAAILLVPLYNLVAGPGTLTVLAPHALLPTSLRVQPATVRVDLGTGKVVGIWGGIREDVVKGKVVRLGEDEWMLPGMIDTHVHLNSPGRSHWESIRHGTLAALSGGVTTLVDMPLNSLPPTNNVSALETKRKVAKGNAYTDIAFWGGSVPGNERDLKPLWEAGVRGFKSFMVNSGVDEFQHVSAADIEAAFTELSNTSTPLLYHAEVSLPTPPEESSASPTLHSTWLSSRPNEMEDEAISLLLSLLRAHPHTHAHIVHLSSASALPLIRAARAEGLNLTVETCFHYLVLRAEDIPEGATQFKCAPPIRGEANRRALWEALRDGDIDMVTSDHSPSVPELKELESGDFMKAWGGIGGLGLGISLLWSEASAHSIPIGTLIKWMSAAPAQLAGLSSKGAIRLGADADFAIFAPEDEFTVSKDDLHFLNKISPYEGLTLKGVVRRTFLRGKLVWDKTGKGAQGRPRGRLI